MNVGSGSYGSVFASPNKLHAIKKMQLIKDGMIEGNNVMEVTTALCFRRKLKKSVIKAHTAGVQKRTQRRKGVPCDVDITLIMDRGVHSLHDYVLSTSKPILMIRSKQIFVELLAAVHNMHAIGLTHNDLKPANMVLDTNYNLRLIDLGSCRVIRYGGNVWCTLCFSAPESLKDDAKPTMVSDAFSVGAIGYFMVTGGSYLYNYKKYSTRSQVTKMYEKHGVNIPATPPFGCCPKLYEVIQAMLNPDPTQRMTVEAAFIKLTNLVPIVEDPGELFTNSPRYGLTAAKRAEREKRVDYIYNLFALTSDDKSFDVDAFALAINLMDRYEEVKEREATTFELFSIANLAIIVVRPDTQLKIGEGIEDNIIDVMMTLDFELYSETCCLILERMYQLDPKSIDHKRLCAAVKAGMGDSFKAAEEYMAMV